MARGQAGATGDLGARQAGGKQATEQVPGEGAGSELLQALSAVARLREMTELEERLGALEARLGEKR